MAKLNYKEKFPAAFSKLLPRQVDEVARVVECRTYYDGDVLLKGQKQNLSFM